MDAKPHDDPECSCSNCLEWLGNLDRSDEQAQQVANYDERAEKAQQQALDRIP